MAQLECKNKTRSASEPVALWHGPTSEPKAALWVRMNTRRDNLGPSLGYWNGTLIQPLTLQNEEGKGTDTTSSYRPNFLSQFCTRKKTTTPSGPKSWWLKIEPPPAPPNIQHPQGGAVQRFTSQALRTGAGGEKRAPTIQRFQLNHPKNTLWYQPTCY